MYTVFQLRSIVSDAARMRAVCTTLIACTTAVNVGQASVVMGINVLL